MACEPFTPSGNLHTFVTTLLTHLSRWCLIRLVHTNALFALTLVRYKACSHLWLFGASLSCVVRSIAPLGIEPLSPRTTRRVSVLYHTRFTASTASPVDLHLLSPVTSQLHGWRILQMTLTSDNEQAGLTALCYHRKLLYFSTRPIHARYIYWSPRTASYLSCGYLSHFFTPSAFWLHVVRVLGIWVGSPTVHYRTSLPPPRALLFTCSEYVS